MAIAALKFMNVLNASRVTGGMNHPILSLNYREIGENVYAGSISKEVLNDVTAVCRRRFRGDDVLVYVDTDENEEYNSGIVFTEDRIFTWTDNEGCIEEVAYADISAVDYNDHSVTISYNGGTCALYLGENAEDEKYSRYMYNFIMDIMELDSDEVIDEQNRQKYINDWVINVVEHMDMTQDSLIECIKSTIPESAEFEATEENLQKMDRYLRASGCTGIKLLVGEAYDFLDIYVWKSGNNEEV